MRITVCEMPDGVRGFEAAWEALREHAEAQRSELVVLPEMPAHPWFAHGIGFEGAVWRRALEAHDAKLVGGRSKPTTRSWSAGSPAWHPPPSCSGRGRSRRAAPG